MARVGVCVRCKALFAKTRTRIQRDKIIWVDGNILEYIPAHIPAPNTGLQVPMRHDQLVELAWKIMFEYSMCFVVCFVAALV